MCTVLEKNLKYCKYTVLLTGFSSNDVQLKTSTSLTGAAFGGTKPSISFLVIRPSGPEPGKKIAQYKLKLFFTAPWTNSVFY